MKVVVLFLLFASFHYYHSVCVSADLLDSKDLSATVESRTPPSTPSSEAPPFPIETPPYEGTPLPSSLQGSVVVVTCKKISSWSGSYGLYHCNVTNTDKKYSVSNIRLLPTNFLVGSRGFQSWEIEYNNVTKVATLPRYVDPMRPGKVHTFGYIQRASKASFKVIGYSGGPPQIPPSKFPPPPPETTSSPPGDSPSPPKKVSPPPKKKSPPPKKKSPPPKRRSPPPKKKSPPPKRRFPPPAQVGQVRLTQKLTKFFNSSNGRVNEFQISAYNSGPGNVASLFLAFNNYKPLASWNIIFVGKPDKYTFKSFDKYLIGQKSTYVAAGYQQIGSKAIITIVNYTVVPGNVVFTFP